MRDRTRRWVLVVSIAGALAATPVAATEATRSGAPEGTAPAPEAFLEEAAVGSMAEVKLGGLAQERATSGEVKDFGKRMVADHGKANAELKRIADKKKMTLPKDVDAKHRAVHDRLAKLSGADFDRAYAQAMVEDHRHDVAAFRAATKSSDPDVRDFATRTLPTLEEHLEMAERLAMGGDAGRAGPDGGH